MSKVKVRPFFSVRPRKTITVNELATYIGTHPAQVLDLIYRHLDPCPTLRGGGLSACTCGDELEAVVQVQR